MRLSSEWTPEKIHNKLPLGERLVRGGRGFISGLFVSVSVASIAALAGAEKAGQGNAKEGEDQGAENQDKESEDHGVLDGGGVKGNGRVAAAAHGHVAETLVAVLVRFGGGVANNGGHGEQTHKQLHYISAKGSRDQGLAKEGNMKIYQ